MSIIEVACFNLQSSVHEGDTKPWLQDAPYDKASSTIRSLLAKGIRILDRHAKSSFHLLQDLNDPQLVYYIGKWRTLDDFTNFCTSKDRGDLVHHFQEANARWEWRRLYETLSHERSILPSLLHSRDELAKAKVLSWVRQNVAPEDVEKFQSKFNEVKGQLEKFSGYKTIYGLKVDADSARTHDDTPLVEQKDPDREEFLVLAGWDSREQRAKFPDSEEFAKYAQTRAWVKWFERTVAVPVLLE